MPRLPRRDLIEEPEVGIYHCVQRAVRRAFLCGQDAVTGQNFDHRKAWIQQRLEFLAGQFGIEVLSFASVGLDGASITAGQAGVDSG
ncbi:MAG: Type I secretion system protein TolC [Planctomycetota bacterium]|nr:Type I secretion system protein TolC [Planctomycetota bacterium]